MCRAHATVRGFVGEIVANPQGDRDILVDMEAGLEHLSRGTGRHVSRFLAVLEPYYRSMETARRVAELAHELGIHDVKAVANKLRDDDDRLAIADYCNRHGIELIAEIPWDGSLLQAERAGRTPIDHDARTPAVQAIERLADRLIHPR